MNLKLPAISGSILLCSVRWMSLRVSASPCEKWRRASLSCVWSLSAEPTGAGFHTEARSLGSDVVDVCVLTISINFSPASLLYLSRESTMNLFFGSSTLTKKDQSEAN